MIVENIWDQSFEGLTNIVDVFLAVTDNGIGMDAAHHERVFDRFYRVSPDRGDVGAGLGLAIVKSICHAHGGSVALNSAADIGSIFRVELPLLSPDAANVLTVKRRMMSAPGDLGAKRGPA
jgi:signal transduction histidine kinase